VHTDVSVSTSDLCRSSCRGLDRVLTRETVFYPMGCFRDEIYADTELDDSCQTDRTNE
jgi:hypothetical protein